MQMHNKQQAIEYIKNNNGVVKKERFLEDFEPIGEKLLSQLINEGDALTDTSGKTTIIFLADDDV